MIPSSSGSFDKIAPKLLARVFFGKKIFGNSVKNSDKLSKKIVFWTLLISVSLSLFIGLSGMGSGMGG